MPYLFDQTPRLLFCAACFCVTTIQGWCYLLGKPTDINDGWIRDIRTSNKVTAVRCGQEYAQPLSPAVSHGNNSYNVQHEQPQH